MNSMTIPAENLRVGMRIFDPTSTKKAVHRIREIRLPGNRRLNRDVILEFTANGEKGARMTSWRYHAKDIVHVVV